MQTIFSTSDVDPRHRFAYWHDVASEKLIRHDATPLDAAQFRAEMRYGAIGEIELAQFDTSPLQITRHAHHIADHEIENLFLVRQISGRFMLEQSGRSALLESGDMVLIESALPSMGSYLDDSRGLGVKLPRRVLVDHLGDMSDLVARPIRRTGGAATLLSSLLTTLPSHAGRLDAPTSKITIDYLLGLLARALDRDAANR